MTSQSRTTKCNTLLHYCKIFLDSFYNNNIYSFIFILRSRWFKNIKLNALQKYTQKDITV